MKIIKDGNVYAVTPDDGFVYITNGSFFASKLFVAEESAAESWHDTNDEPPKPELGTEVTAEEALSIITGGADDETE